MTTNGTSKQFALNKMFNDDVGGNRPIFLYLTKLFWKNRFAVRRVWNQPLPKDKQLFILLVFIEIYRVTNFDPSIWVTGKYWPGLADETISKNFHLLAKTYIDRFGKIPFHKQGDRTWWLFPKVDGQLKAMERMSPNKKIQKAIAPVFLCCMTSLSVTTIANNVKDHAIDLLILTFFFGMRMSEIVKVSTLGCTKLLTLGSMTFLAKDWKRIVYDNLNL